MPDTRDSRDKQGHDEEKRQREHELEDALEEAINVRDRRDDHDEDVAERDLADEE